MTKEEQQIKQLKQQLAEGVEIAKAFQKETGMVWGERIGEFLKDVEGTHFNSLEYHFEKQIGDQ